jgi:hypothetical protein
MNVDKKWIYAIVAYIVGSFFGLSQLLGLFGGMGSKAAAAA